MTSEEFEKITSLKREIDNLEKLLYRDRGHLEYPIIYINVSYINGKDAETSISPELSDAIIKLLEERVEKLKTEFNNFKTE